VNLHGLVSPVIATVNPMVDAVLRTSTGYTTDNNGKQVPRYADAVMIKGQKQEMNNSEIQFLNGLGITGILNKVYVNGALNSIDRADGLGGDMLGFSDGNWLVVKVQEAWPDWTCAVIQKQVNL
jgi:hypothetical protein